MRVLIVAIGSRGDVAPYTGLGAALVDAGREVTVAAHAPFEELIRRAGLGFKALGGDVQALVAAPPDGRRPSPLLLARRIGLRIPAIGTFAQPIEPTGAFPPILGNSARSLGRWGNRVSADLVLRTLTPYRKASAESVRPA
jgi:hypothetical protein